MHWKLKCNHLIAVINIIHVMRSAEPFAIDQDDTILRVTKTSTVVMSWSYTGTQPSLANSRQIEKNNSNTFEVVLDHLPFTGYLDLQGVFENKNVTYAENDNALTVTIYDFEEKFHGEYRSVVDVSSGSPAYSGLKILFLCVALDRANLTGPTTQISGQDINLTCVAKSNSMGVEYRKNVTTIYYWEVDGELVTADETHEFRNNQMENSVNSSLLIKNIGPQMHGNNYTCFAVEDGCEMKSLLSSAFMLEPEDPNTLTSSQAPDDTSVSTDTPPPTKDTSVTQPSSTPTVTASDDPPRAPRPGWNHWYILLIALGCLVILVVIAVVIHRRSQRKDDDLDPVTELKPPSVHAAPADHVRANTAGYRPSQHQQLRREDNTAYYVQATSGARL